MGLYDKSLSKARQKDKRYSPGRRTKKETVVYEDERSGNDRGFVALDFTWNDIGSVVTLGMYIDPDRYDDIPYILNKAESVLLNYNSVILK